MFGFRIELNYGLRTEEKRNDNGDGGPFLIGILLVAGLALSGGFSPNTKKLDEATSSKKTAASPAPPLPVKPKPTPPAKPPEPLTSEWEEKFRAIAITKGRDFDLRYIDNDDPGLKDCFTLSQMGYLRVRETGPGGSVQSFQLTDAGHTAAREIAIKHDEQSRNQ